MPQRYTDLQAFEAFCAHKLDDKTIVTVAEEMGIPKPSAGTIIKRAHRILCDPRTLTAVYGILDPERDEFAESMGIETHQVNAFLEGEVEVDTTLVADYIRTWEVPFGDLVGTTEKIEHEPTDQPVATVKAEPAPPLVPPNIPNINVDGFKPVDDELDEHRSEPVHRNEKEPDVSSADKVDQSGMDADAPDGCGAQPDDSDEAFRKGFASAERLYKLQIQIDYLKKERAKLQVELQVKYGITSPDFGDMK